jgi:hypothetical protein
MIIKEIQVNVSFTKNLGNYQSVKPEAGVTITIEPGDNVDEVYKKAWDLAGDEIEKQLKVFDGEERVKKGLK